MCRFVEILLVTCLGVALCTAQAPRYRIRNGRAFLARQEVAVEAGVTPYPSAKDLIPEIPFDEAAAAAAPEEVPVAVEAPEEEVNVSLKVDLPAEQDTVVDVRNADNGDNEHEPDLIYGPPEVDDVPTVNEISPIEDVQATIAEDEEVAVGSVGQTQAERLIFGRRINARNSIARPAKLRAQAARSARIVKSKIVTKSRPARLQQLPQ